MLLGLALILAGLAAGTCRAAPPPAFPFAEGLAPPTLKAKPATVLHLGGYTIQFERTSMLEVVRNLGLGEIRHQRDAGDSLSWICYAITGKNSTQLLWITSGELQGGQIVDGVVAKENPADGWTKADCPDLPAKFRPAALDGGLWLGSSRADLQAALPQAPSERQGWFEYGYAGKHTDRYTDPENGKANMVDYDESSYLLVRLVDGRLTALFAGKDTTY